MPHRQQRGQLNLQAGELAALQLLLPFRLPEEVRTWLGSASQLGIGVTLCRQNPHKHTTPTPSAVEGATLQFFDKQRLLDEVSLFSPGKELAQQGWLTIAGCGKRGRDLYVVGLTDEHEGQIYLWKPTQEQLTPLHLSLKELAARAKPVVTELRRRLPGGVRSIKPPPAEPKRRPRRRPAPLSAVARTLPLFAEPVH